MRCLQSSTAIFLALIHVYGQAQPVIDVHMHVLEDAESLPPHPLFPSAAGVANQAEWAAATLKQMREHGVVLGVLHDSAEAMEQLKSQDPSRFVAFPMLGGPGQAVELATLEANFASGAWGGIGEILTVYNGLHPADPSLRPYYEIANRHGVPVFWHSGIRPGLRAELGRPLHWEEILIEFPDVKPVLLHAGAPFRDEMVAIMGTYPNVHVDTGPFVHLLSPEQFYAYYGYLIEVGLGNRIMFGTDWLVPDVIAYSIEVIENAPWDAQVKRDILYNNAARFLGLSDEQIRSHHAE
jgi:predicted TIM-barrel fold metal-dependent hydrolase